MDILLMIMSLVFAGGLAWGIIWLTSWYKRYNEFKVVVWEKDGFGQWNERMDRAGVFVDKKTNNKRLFLKKFNVGLNADNIPYLPGVKGSKVVYMVRTGLKNFHFVRVNPDFPNITLSVGEEDVNWAINAYERQKKLFQNSLLIQLLPFLALAFVGIIIAIIFIYFFKNLDSLREFGQYMKETAQIMLQMKTGTVMG